MAAFGAREHFRLRRALSSPRVRLSRSMIVLGVDPGSRVCGWGVVARDRGRYVRVASGTIRTDPATPMAERLRVLHEGVGAAIRANACEAVAIEAIFAYKSSTSALVLGQARGVALLAAAQAGLPVFEYNASTVKKSVSGSGRAEKQQIAFMVGRMLGLTGAPPDETDALAIAITHHGHAGIHARLAAAGAR